MIVVLQHYRRAMTETCVGVHTNLPTNTVLYEFEFKNILYLERLLQHPTVGRRGLPENRGNMHQYP